MGDFASHVDLIDMADFEHPISIHIFKPTSFYVGTQGSRELEPIPNTADVAKNLKLHRL